MCSLFPSSTVISTAGPENLTASQSGMLNMLLKDDKGNLHQLVLENALVVLGCYRIILRHTNS
jgi:hypothetical protein